MFSWLKKSLNGKGQSKSKTRIARTTTPVTLPDWFKEDIVTSDFPSGWSSIRIPEEKSVLIKAEVENLMYDTWQYEERLGRDAKNLHHSCLQIKAIYVIHNDSLIDQYQKAKYDIIAEAHQYPERQMPPLACVKGQREIKTIDSSLDSSLWMYDHSVNKNSKDINEVYLFHGTKSKNISGIMTNGFTLEKASNGLFGKALYLAESSEKADQYTDASNSRRHKNLCMVISKTALGRTYVHRGGGTLSSLPCTKKGCFTPSCSEHTQKFNTAVAGVNKRFREFLVHDTKQCYPHVFVFYERRDERKKFENTDIACYLIGPKNDIENFTESNLIYSTTNQTKFELDDTLAQETGRDIIKNYKHMRANIIEKVDLYVRKMPCCKCLASAKENKMIYDKELLKLSDEIHYLHTRLNMIEEKLQKLQSSCPFPVYVSMRTTDYNATKKLFITRWNSYDVLLKKWMTCHSHCQLSTLV